jgi:hypothetical protein
MKKKFHSNESFKHKLAKGLLIEWLKDNPRLIGLESIIKITTEETQCEGGNIVFCPDITIYSDIGICAFIEIFNKHAVSDVKIDNIYRYLFSHKWLFIDVLEISADWIMNQTKQPEELLYQRYTFANHDILDNLF